jgi:alkylated DNA nucleotide flippase Atl1
MTTDRVDPGRPRHDAHPRGDDRPDFIEQVMRMVRAIPPGRVMTYGDIAIVLTARAERAGLGDSYGPRMVGFVMSRFGSALPWWRVIRAGGYPPRSLHAEAWPHYVKEGTPLVGTEEGYRIDLRRARFDPNE